MDWVLVLMFLLGILFCFSMITLTIILWLLKDFRKTKVIDEINYLREKEYNARVRKPSGGV